MSFRVFTSALFIALHGCAPKAASAPEPSAEAPPAVEIAPAAGAPTPKAPPDEDRPSDEDRARGPGGELRSDGAQGGASAPRPAADLASPEGRLHAEALGDIRRGDRASARKKLERILRDHPKSSEADFAKVALAELFFEAGKVRKAEALLERVLGAAGAELVTYARYKLAWIRFSRGKQTQALTDALAAHRTAAKGASSSKYLASLMRALARDLPLFYAHVGSPSKAEAFFSRVADTPDGAEKMLEWLALRYEEAGKARDAIVVYQALARGTKTACPHLRRIAELYHLVGDGTSAANADAEVTRAGCP